MISGFCLTYPHIGDAARRRGLRIDYAIGAFVATVATLVGGGYAVAMTISALGPVSVLPLVVRRRDGLRFRSASAIVRAVAHD